MFNHSVSNEHLTYTFVVFDLKYAFDVTDRLAFYRKMASLAH
jgi:hypothetical protein